MVTILVCVAHPCYIVIVNTGLVLRWPVTHGRFSPSSDRVTRDKVGALCEDIGVKTLDVHKCTSSEYWGV